MVLEGRVCALEIVQLMNLFADQHKMIDSSEDSLDEVVSFVLNKTQSLEDDDLEDVQAAALPFVINKNLNGKNRGE